MKYRKVLTSEQVGFASDFGEYPAIMRDYAPERGSYRCELDCGHFHMVFCACPPIMLECLECGEEPVQLVLPLVLPLGVRYGH